MKMRKILNGVLACTMALSMGSVVGASEAPVVDAQADIMIEQSEITPMMVMNETTGDMVEVVCESDDVTNDEIRDIVNSISFSDDSGIIHKITINSKKITPYNTFSFDDNVTVTVNTVHVEGEFLMEADSNLGVSTFASNSQVTNGVLFELDVLYLTNSYAGYFLHKTIYSVTGNLTTYVNQIASSEISYRTFANGNYTSSSISLKKEGAGVMTCKADHLHNTALGEVKNYVLFEYSATSAYSSVGVMPSLYIMI
ncbi:MAG: hypothetical protein R3Y63_14665 [Eubacteriales bacterium]